MPQTLEEWAGPTNCEVGFEPIKQPRATLHPPGSLEKVEVLRQRLASGQRLHSPYDVGAFRDTADDEGWSIIGEHDYGLVAGRDATGHPHRYAIWSAVDRARPGDPYTLLYVPAYSSYHDRFDQCPELYAIMRHARASGANRVIVCPLFSARIRSERDLRGIADPCTPHGLYWLRILAKQAKRTIVCWGETAWHARHLDARRVLPNTLWAVGEGEWPPMVTRLTSSGMVRHYIGSDLTAPETDRYIPEFD